MGMDLLRSWRLHLAVGTLYAVGGAMLTLGTMLAVHRDGYAETGWPRLRESVGVVRELNRFADADVHTDVPFYAKHSEPLRALRLLLPPFARRDNAAERSPARHPQDDHCDGWRRNCGTRSHREGSAAS
jgi:hypothetical protein